MKYVALLRGVNVGGNKKVPMPVLVSLFERLKYTGIRTYLNSGNIVFSSSVKDKKKLRNRIEKAIEAEFGFAVAVVIIDDALLQRIVRENTFAKTKIPPKLQFVFFPIEQTKAIAKAGIIGDFNILRVDEDVFYAHAIKLENNKFPNFDRIFGVPVTSRNWLTVRALAQMMCDKQ